MRVAKGFAGAAAAAVAAVLTAAAPVVAAPAAENYVALGDSYTSGVGAGEYDDSGCKRSANAYPQLYAAQSGANLSFQACTGASTDDVLSDQISAVTADTTLVSISVGGNDAGFVSTMTSCITGGDDGCKEATDEAIAYAQNTLPGKLDAVYSEIKNRAPSARVVALSYPHIYEIGGSCSVGLSDTSRGYINNAADVLADVTADRAGAAGFAFGDTRPAFTGHEICSDDEWLNSVTFPVNESYHPTADGQSGGYLPTFTGALG